MLLRRDPADRQFARFCATGDPQALGDVFDRTAGRLMRVALWLAGNRADAEDLLQRTFLLSIETRAQFRAGERVLPWLMGLLGNQARQQRRDRERAAARLPLPQASTDKVEDPHVEVAARELAAAVGAVRDRLGEPYQEVLRLHLEQGCNAKEIAARLGRPAGTVRTQLLRALELLRSKLPSGFIAGLTAVAAFDVAALGAVRGAVVNAARVAMPTAVGGGAAVVASSSLTLLGTLMAKKLLFVIPLVLLLLGAALWPSSWFGDGTNPGAAGGPPKELVERAGTEQAAQPTPSPAAGERVAAHDASGGLVDPGFAALRVHLRWQDDGSPAAGIGISARCRGASDAFARDAITDDQGTALLQRLPAGSYSVDSAFTSGELRPSGSADSVKSVVLSAGELQTAHVVAVRTSTASGKVVDAQGLPVQGASLWVSAGSNWSRGWQAGRSAADGSFAVPLRSFHYLGARHDGHVPANTLQVSAESGPHRDLLLQLRGPAARIEGTVLDARGQPVVGARVRIGPNGGGVIDSGVAGKQFTMPNPEQRITDRDGRFTATEVPPGGCNLWIWGLGFGPLRERVELAAGTMVARTWTLADGATVRGVVRDSAGKAIARAGVGFGDEFYNFPQARTATADDGSFELRDLPAWPSTQLRAGKSGLSVTTNLALQAGAVTEWNPVLDNGRTVSGRVLGPDDRPMAGLRVGSVHPNYQQPQRWFDTDAEGRFELLNVGDDPRDLRVAQGEVVLTELQRVAPDSVDLVIRLTSEDLPTARLRGRILDARGQAVQGMVLLQRRGVEYRVNVQIDATTGAFTFGPGPAGRYALSAFLGDAGRLTMGEVELVAMQEVVLPDVVLQPPGSIEFTAVDSAGQPIDGARSMLRSSHEGGAGGTVEQGRGAFTALQPGTYLLEVWPQGRAPDVLRAAVVVHSGAVTSVQLRGQPAVQVDVRVRDPRPKVADLTVTWVCTTPDGELVQWFSTYAASREPLRATTTVPVGRYRLEGTASDGRTVQVDLEVTAEHLRKRRLPTIEVELPAQLPR